MTSNRINYINTALIIFSCAIAFVIPFELFLFSYAVLGPLHYLTEIGWLHKKNYFTKGKYDFIFLIGLCFFLLFVPAFIPLSKDSTFAPNVVALAVFLSLIFVLVEDRLYRIALVVLALLAVGLVNKSPAYLIWIGLFLPTIIHVFIFTLAFMLFGALKEKSLSGYLSIAVLIVCAASFFLIKPEGLQYVVSNDVYKSYFQFASLNFNLINIFHLDTLQKTSDIFTSNAGFVIMRFIAFAYTYHYLNWFSKTSVIKWHKVPKQTLVLTVAIWLLSIALYAYDYNLGLQVLFFLSFLHVLLEFPLNVMCFTGIGKALTGSKGPVAGVRST
ncbi:MAG: hypothetical protein WA071_05190 [Undibacterium umbellatum]|uniref:hypothetical protein n=1 Tax=Undibacterium umbellatum TaxID=2762300 RepID=UPI003BB5B6F9